MELEPIGAVLAEGMVKALNNNTPAEDEYLNPDDRGLRYCRNCHTPRQTEITMKIQNEMVTIRPSIQCKCIREALEAQTKAKQANERADRISRRKRQSGIPTLYAEASFDTFIQNGDNAPIYSMTKRYADKFSEMKRLGKGLLLHGGVGTGKTYAAACIANQLLNNDESVCFTSTYDMTRLRSPADEEEYTDRLMSASLLIVDDIGAERSNEYGREKVFGYIDSRCNTDLPLILTTNLDFKRFLNPENQQAARVYDRINKRCFPVAFTGASWRRAEARDNFAEMKAILQGSE